MNQDYTAQFQREWSEFLNEIRVALPGVQFLFGFLLTVPLLGVGQASAIATVMAGLFAWLWFGLPLMRRERDRERT